MTTSLLTPLLLFLLHLSAAARPLSTTTTTATAFIKSSCTTATYPHLCYTSLSNFKSEIQPNPRSVATKSLFVALSAAKSASSSAWRLVHSRARMPSPVSRSVFDCAILLTDAVKQLQRSVGVMGGPATTVEVGDVQTWTSASLTDASTCLEELDGPLTVKSVMTLKKQVMDATQFTSNALALLNDYGSSTNRPHQHHSRRRHQKNNHHP